MGAGGKYPNRHPLPPFSGTLLFRTAPFGTFEATDIGQILTDETLYNDGAPRWRNAPRSDDAINRRRAAAIRLNDPAYVNRMGAAELALILASCSPGSRCGSQACYECCRAFQRWLISAIAKLIRIPRIGYKDFTLNFVMPEGQAGIKHLNGVNFDGIMAIVQGALDRCYAVEFGVVAIDISVNVDTAKFLAGKFMTGPKIYFQVHVYGIVRTSNRQGVWNALRHLFGNAANIYRPLHIPKKAFDGANKGISYLLKPNAFRRVSYLNTNATKPYWTTVNPAPALKASEHVEYLIEMHKLGFAHRIALVGLHPVITKTTKSGKRGVALRKVFRGRSAM